jgi:hypothetical protein
MKQMHELTTYQNQIARTVVDSVLQEQRLTITVEIARGGGAKELSAQLEMLLLGLHVNDGVRLLRMAPSSTETTQQRLVGFLSQGPLDGLWSAGNGIVRLGRSAVRFATPEKIGPAVVEANQHALGLIEVADAQLLTAGDYDRWIEPLARTTGATTVLYGFPLNGESRFEEIKQHNRDLEAVDGIKRHFRVTADQVSAELSGYGKRIEQARAELGEEHPTFQSNYLLRPASANGPLLSDSQHHGLEGAHARQHEPSLGQRTVASIVVTRLPRTEDLAAPVMFNSPGASAIVTIAERTEAGGLDLVEHRWLQAIDAGSLARQIARVVDDWRVEHITVDDRTETQTFQYLLEYAVAGIAMEWAAPSIAHDSYLAMKLLTAVNTDALALYRPDGSPEHRALRYEMENATASCDADGLRVLQAPGNEGFLRGLLLLLRAIGPAAPQPIGVLETALAS